MGKLKVLPANIANMIAAGEVVQRPASVVKELMENAIDAGATQIDVVVKDAGRTSIQVIDNGSGMSPADAVLCFERHATSKIAEAEDLQHITSYGFRGEALASIAAVAEVTLKTRRVQDDTGTQVTISDPTAVKTSSVAAPTGSNFLVRNLFYNTPARRKFLKSDNIELKHIVEDSPQMIALLWFRFEPMTPQEIEAHLAEKRRPRPGVRGLHAHTDLDWTSQVQKAPRDLFAPFVQSMADSDAELLSVEFYPLLINRKYLEEKASQPQAAGRFKAFRELVADMKKGIKLDA